jgi:hypothetical protein
MRVLPYLACLLLLLFGGDGPDWVIYLWWLVIGLMSLDLALHLRSIFSPPQRPSS